MDKIVAKEMMDANGIPESEVAGVDIYRGRDFSSGRNTADALRGKGAYRRFLLRRVFAEGPHRTGGRAAAGPRLLRPCAGGGTGSYGREVTDAVLGERYLPAVESFPAVGNFDYTAKYQVGGAKEVCPAELTEAEAKAVGEMAMRVHKALGLSVYSRTDMILDKNGQIWCLEANSLPGMTPNSFVPKEAAAVGISYDDLCEEIVEQSLKIKRR